MSGILCANLGLLLYTDINDGQLEKRKNKTNGHVNAHLTISEKKGQHRFLDAQEQLTLWSIIRSD